MRKIPFLNFVRLERYNGSIWQFSRRACALQHRATELPRAPCTDIFVFLRSLSFSLLFSPVILLSLSIFSNHTLCILTYAYICVYTGCPVTDGTAGSSMILREKVSENYGISFRMRFRLTENQQISITFNVIQFIIYKYTVSLYALHYFI